MKTSFFILLTLFSGFAFADANSDAYNAGSSYGKGSASQGTSALKSTDSVSSAIPGYTSSPSQSSYYGGVTGGDSGLSDKGQAALGNSTAGQAVVDSSTKNPVPTIDPSAPYITIGKAAESGSESVLDGTGQQCTEATVSKSTFETFTCEQDVWTEQICSRDATATGSMGAPVQTSTTIQVAAVPNGRTFSFTLPQSVTVVSSWVTMTGDSGGINQMGMNGSINNVGLTLRADTQMDINLTGAVSAGQVITSGEFCPGLCNNATKSMTAGLLSSSSIILTLNVVTWTQQFVPSVSWSENCAISKTGAVKTGSVCTSSGGSRTVTNNGQTYEVYSDCWQYTDTYMAPSNSPGTCGTLASNPACTVNSKTCTQQSGSYCEHQTVSYECQKVYSSSGLVCGGDYFCKTGDCSDTQGAGDSGFDTAVAKLAGLASAADDVRSDTVTVKAFTGKAMSCRKAFAGFSNCCKDSGWGADAGLAACNSDEMAIGKAKAKKVTVSVGERCDHKVLGACIQKSQVYCVFQGKLARIIQEQGRRDQLHVSFGSGDSPDCRGITVPELQDIDFDLINFADFYDDLINNQKIPDASTMAQLAKDRVAAQVNQMGGTTK